ncbi:vanadium-dependent haloperoxidase [Dyadobacter sp. CY261]|uniref:vanadium-dependent haloperoxidase n=1 Tax=Dyadobacter sp. CY261 TaxID=2907203 RepID=UPI001F362C5F|nr:vanadium-dependent haloperoxidase [Dyadobacter sp. CY261]MCF0072900.1 vanadium-dependent haloperoxidase [Dyadobacter sp. CY261]
MKQMKQLTRASRILMLAFAATLWATSCTDHEPTNNPDAGSFSAEIAASWLTMQLKIAQSMPAPPPVLARRFAYSGITLYESVVPGLAGYQSIAPQLSNLPALPQITSGTYYWPASANAALAEINRSIHPGLSAVNKAKIDSLEAANLEVYKQSRPIEELERSAAFGRSIALAIFNWSKTDGYDNATPYTPLSGPSYWKPTPPAFAPAILSNWGKVRLLVANSDQDAPQGAPIPYSEDPASPYFKQAEELYNISQSLTTEQRNIATYWPDNSWHNILSQVLAKEKPKLGKAAVAFAQLGIAMSDAAISLCKEKYVHQGVRPVTFIRSVMNRPSWNTVIPTPPHPEFPSGHSVMSAAAAETLSSLFGQNYAFTDVPYNLPAFAPRHFNSFEEAAAEAAVSRVYAGIHYRKTCEVSLVHGKKVAQNVTQKLKFN